MTIDAVGLIAIEALGILFALVVGWLARSRVVKKEHDEIVKWRATVDSSLPQLMEDFKKADQEQRDFRQEIRKEFKDLREENHKEHVKVAERLTAIETTLKIERSDL